MEDFDIDAWHDEFDSPAFKHGMEIGESRGSYKTVQQAQRAYDAGEIELWLAFHAPKSLEGWEAWDEKYGKEFHKRWEVNDADNSSGHAG